MFKHILRNALSPILTATNHAVRLHDQLVILVEVIFDWPGIGLYAYQSFQVFDYSPVIALAIVSTAGFRHHQPGDGPALSGDRPARAECRPMSVSSQPARRAIRKPKGLLLPLALLVVAILALSFCCPADRAARSDCARHGGRLKRRA